MHFVNGLHQNSDQLQTMADIVVALGGFLAPTIKTLIEFVRNTATSYAYNLTELEDLAAQLEVIRSMVDRAGEETCVNNAAAVGQLWRLKDAIHDMTGIILNKLHEEVPAARRAITFGTWRLVSSGTAGASNSNSNNKSLDNLADSMEHIRQYHKRLQDLNQVSPCKCGLSRLGTGSLPTGNKLFGYEQEYEELLETLNYGHAGVVAIIGHAGMGKTELARRAFNNQEIVRARFDLRIWVCVYGKFTETELLREIWKSAYGRDPCGEMTVAGLQQELRKKVESAFGRYLLVLDDVCNDESAANDLSRRNTWDTVLAPFKQSGKRGSRILVTTRAQMCSVTLGAGARIELDGLSNAAMVLLLKETAFGDQHVHDGQMPVELQHVLNINVGQLHGSPLAAQQVGSLLKDNCDSRQWKKILNKDHHVAVFDKHLSSFQDLPPHLQRCFAFCSIFPKKWRFEPDKLTMMWMALGFVESPPGSNSGGMTREEEEEVARSYFHALVQRSLFQEAATANDNSEESYYVIHEHIHSMIRRVCPAYFQSIDGPNDSVTVTVCHLSITTSRLSQVLQKRRSKVLRELQLRTLLVFNDDPSLPSNTGSVIRLLKKCEGVQVLDISDTCIDAFPNCIVDKMEHLRYLGLPNSINNLGDRLRNRPLHVQTLYLKSVARMAWIGSLEKLHGSVEFDLGKRQEEGHDIGELEKLNSLRQVLSIIGLETVRSMQEAMSAQLGNKEYLKVLKLQWRYSDQQPAQASDSDVLEGLQPHPNLEKMHIEGYLWITLPEWLEDHNVLQNLRSLYLKNCRELKDLPLVGNLPHLELLNIKNLCSVETISHTFCTTGKFESLEKLVLEGMPRLVSWEAEPIICSPILFPKLRDVKIIRCPRLSSLTGLLYCRGSLIDLHVEKCRRVTTIFSRCSFPLLTTEPYLSGCPGLLFKESPPQGEVLIRSFLLLLVLFAFFIYHKIYPLYVIPILRDP